MQFYVQIGPLTWLKLPLDASQLQIEREADAPAKGAGKTRLLTITDLDGRTRAAQVVKATITSIAGDLGGEDHLTTAELQIVNRAALVGAMCEDIGVRWLAGEEVDPVQFATLSNAERRLLETVGLKRRPRNVTPDLQTYLRQRVTERPMDSFAGQAASSAPAEQETRTGGHSEGQISAKAEG